MACQFSWGNTVVAGMVYFVGAGPGHPGLITLRGVECLRRADAVLYDYLANARTLCHAPQHAELICLGRHRRADVWSQEAINTEMVRLAQQGKSVVRLKGGDPMVFGRIAEEIAALDEAGVPFEIVPGVTSASAAAAFAGITITDRRYASAVALVTGHEQLGKPDSSLDYESLANFPGTLVIYMGVSTAAQWSQALLDAGKPGDTPVLCVRRTSWPDQQKVACTLEEVGQVLNPYQKLPPPVVIIVGETARPESRLDWFSRLPLLGRGVVITRPLHQAESMVSRLSELGANAILQPAIEIQEPRDWGPVDNAIGRIESFDALVFSSANGVHAFMRRMLSLGSDARRLGRTQLAVIGPRTAEAMKQYSLTADIYPTSYRAEALADAILAEGASEGRRFLLLRASRGREVLAERLTAAGADVEQVVVYQSVDVANCSVETEEQWDAGLVDWVTVTSSAIARSISHLWGDRLRQVKLASISPITSEALREIGLEPAVEAKVYTTDGVIDAILDAESDRS